VQKKLEQHLAELKAMPLEKMLAARYEKFRNIAQFYTVSTATTATAV